MMFEPKANPDDDLSLGQIVLKYQLYFTQYFGPKYAYGVTEVHEIDTTTIEAVARVRPIHQPLKGKTTSFQISRDQFDTWRANVKLYNFVQQ